MADGSLSGDVMPEIYATQRRLLVGLIGNSWQIGPVAGHECLTNLWSITLQGAMPPPGFCGRCRNIRRGFGFSPPMPRYYFDIRENDEIVVDELGMDFPDLQAAAIEAAKSLSDMARDVVPGAECYSLAIEVRNGDKPLFKAAIAYEFKRH